MSTHSVLQYSPRRASNLAGPLRPKTPSPAKKHLLHTTLILPKKDVVSATEAGSPLKKPDGQMQYGVVPDSQFDIQLGTPIPGSDFQKAISSSKRIELSFSLLHNGRFDLPPQGGFKELASLFPTTFEVQVYPPFLIIRVRTLPPKPWPLTVAGMPLRLTTDEEGACWYRGKIGKGPIALGHFDLYQRDEFSEDIVKEAITVFKELQIPIQDIVWYGALWQVTVPDGIDLRKVPSCIAHQPCYYRFESEVAKADSNELRVKIPKGVDFDDTFYAKEPNALLRPGIMVSSSSRSVIEDGRTIDRYKSTTSGILVVDQDGNLFITVAAHGFEEDGIVWHPTPNHGRVIGNIVKTLPGTDIAIVKLNSGLRYINEMFGTRENLSGIRNSLSPDRPHTRIGDNLRMDTPFSGFCEGLVLGLGMRVHNGGVDYVGHVWSVFENGDEPIDGCCGSAILDEQGRVIAFFRYKEDQSGDCFGVSAKELRRRGYEICGGEQTF